MKPYYRIRITVIARGWRDQEGSSGVPRAPGDGEAVVDSNTHTVWRAPLRLHVKWAAALRYALAALWPVRTRF